MKNRYFNNAPFLNFNTFVKALFTPASRLSTWRIFNQAAKISPAHNFNSAASHAYMSRRYMSVCYLPPSFG